MGTVRNYPIEHTPCSLQYVIPGTEVRTPPNSIKPELPREGDQYMIPGTEPISTRELLSRLADKPIQPRRPQRGLAGAELFQSIRD